MDQSNSAADRTVRPGDIDVNSLRSTVDDLVEQGRIIETDVPVDPDLEFASIQKKLDGSEPILFNSVEGWDHLRFVTNLFAREDMVHSLFGFQDRTQRKKQIADAINNPIRSETVESSEAPVHDTIVTDDIDVDEIIAPIRHTEDEEELTTGTGVGLIMGEYFDGGSHVGYNRMNFRWGDVTTFQAVPGGHAWMVMKEYYGEGQIPITVNFGIPPAVDFAAGAGMDYVLIPKGYDELGVAGALQDAPIQIVESAVVDGAYSIANAEFSLEGYLDPKDRRYETEKSEEEEEQGVHPFHPEWAGYMGKAYKAPTFHVEAMTHRDLKTQPILHPMIVRSVDASTLARTMREAVFYELCNRIQEDIVADVSIPYSMTDWGGVILQIDKQTAVDEGYHRNFITSALGTSRGMRVGIAVDTDVDIYSMHDIMWALTTRVDPRHDIWQPVPGGAGQTFQPSEKAAPAGSPSGTEFEGGLAIDATVPYGSLEDAYERPHYSVEDVDLTEWFDEEAIEQAIQNRNPWAEHLSKTGQ